jgi:hypothetical protein
MAVLREWRAEIQRAFKDEYVGYVTMTGLATYRITPGNLAASVAARDLDDERTEIIRLSWWTDTAAIEAFAGIKAIRAFLEGNRFLCICYQLNVR